MKKLLLMLLMVIPVITVAQRHFNTGTNFDKDHNVINTYDTDTTLSQISDDNTVTITVYNVSTTYNVSDFIDGVTNGNQKYVSMILHDVTTNTYFSLQVFMERQYGVRLINWNGGAVELYNR